MPISIDKLAQAINEELTKFAGAADEVVAEAVNKVAKDTVQRLKQTSPKRSGKYAASWQASTLRGGRHYNGKIVHAGGGEYRLTHLLEHGHAVVRGGRVVGHAPAEPHIESAEQAAIDSFITEIQKGVEHI